MDEDNRIWWGADKNSTPAIKRFLSEVKDLVPETIWTYQEVGHTQDAKKEVLRVLGGMESPVTPKPVDLIRRICWIASEPGDIILDSFAGTGTTGHAVLRMNADEKLDRTFVLIQAPFDTRDNEKNQFNICQRMTLPRIKRVIQGYEYIRRGPKGKQTKVKEPGLGGSFTYARVGKQLFGEYRDLGDASYAELAKYIYYTETNWEYEPKAADKKTGRIGEHHGTAYYLLYAPTAKEDWALDLEWLRKVGAKEKCKKLVVYCEKLWAHRDQLAAWEKQAGR
jgi:adenine-specific DNA-methyltransferase